MATLYAWPSTSDRTTSPACSQVEAYLRLAEADFQIQACSSVARSPSGQLPALEYEADVPGQERSEFGAARASIVLASKIWDLDTKLAVPQRSELLAWASLVEQRLDAATEYSMWLEPTGFAEHAKSTYQQQPFPLNRILPLVVRREVARRYVGVKPEALYTDACAALKALADKLRSSGGPYLLGTKPCSLDALFFGHALFYKSSPAAAPALREAMSKHPSLGEYVSYIQAHHFQSAAPSAQPEQQGSASSRGATGASGTEEASANAGWSDAAKGQRKPQPTPETTAADREFRRKSWWWLGGAAATLMGYILLSGQYIDVGQLAQILSSEQDDEEEEGEDAEEGEDEA